MPQNQPSVRPSRASVRTGRHVRPDPSSRAHTPVGSVPRTDGRSGPSWNDGRTYLSGRTVNGFDIESAPACDPKPAPSEGRA